MVKRAGIRRREDPVLLLRLLLVSICVWVCCAGSAMGEDADFPRDGKVIELVESNFESAIASIDYLLVDFYAPWCGHCKRLAPELDGAAPVLARLSNPISIAKIDADKYRKIASKYEIDGFPTLKFFMHGVPVDYRVPRKADLIVRSLKKFAAPDVSFLESDNAIRSFVESAGTEFPIFIGFGLNESLIADYAIKYKKKAWFSIANDFSEEMMVAYDFDKVPAFVALNPKYNEHDVFYGPFEGNFLEDFIRQSLLPLTVPINIDTLKLLDDDKRKIVLTIVEDDADEKSAELIKILRSAASANRDLIFGYLGVRQWEEFADTFDASKSSVLPKLLIWDGKEEYIQVVGSERLEEGDHASQISIFLSGYKDGRTITKKVKGPSFLGFLHSLISINTVYIIVFLVAVFMLLQHLANGGEDPQPRRRRTTPERSPVPPTATESTSEAYNKED